VALLLRSVVRCEKKSVSCPCRGNTKDWYMFLFPVPSFCCCYYRRRRRRRRSYCYMFLCGIDCEGNAYVCVNRKFVERFFLCGSVTESE
jgi:hypothetical protein